MNIGEAARNLLTSGAKARERVVHDDVGLLRDAVELNEQAVGKASAEGKTPVPTLTRDQINRMSLDDIDRYFAGDANGSQASDAVFEVDRLGSNTQLNQSWRRSGLLAVACGVGAIGFTPLVFASAFFAGRALLKKAHANQQVLQSDAGHLADKAQKQSAAVKDAMSQRLADTPEAQAERAQILEERKTLVSHLPRGNGLGQAFATEGEWLTHDEAVTSD